jgi:hypothetical protein
MKNIVRKPDAPVPAGVNYDMWLGPARRDLLMKTDFISISVGSGIMLVD